MKPDGGALTLALALDKLNSWVRSESYRAGLVGGAQRMIYHMKHDLLWHPRGLTMEHRGIVVAVKCRDCSGSGRYTTWDGDKLDHCWACNSSGTAKLRFVETKIENNITWHTPAHKFHRSLEEPYQIEMAYAPNQKGKDLEPWEAAALLNQTEPWFRKPYDEHTDYGAFNAARYQLYVGRTPAVCEFCAAEDIRGGYCCSSKNIAWTAYACERCDKEIENGQGSCAIFKAFAFPMKLADHPEIRRWMERHPA